jgi:apolipoprotein N-acyltransferase
MWGLIFVLHWLAPVANAIWDRGSKSQAATRPLLVFLAAMAVVWLYGEARVKLAPIAATVRVAGVSPPPDLDWLLDQQIPPVMEPEQLRANRAEYRPASFTLQDRLFEITESEARAGARVVVWSEMAAPVSYRKTHLVPGTEEELTVPGDGKAKVTHTSAGRLASAICFDLDYPATIRQMANSGIDVLAGPSHDFEPVRDIHARMAVLRAIENGVALMRPTANGVGIATDAYGRTLSSAGYLRSGGATLVAHLPVRGVRTLYSRWGDWFAWVCVLDTFALAAAPTVSVFPKTRSSTTS